MSVWIYHPKLDAYSEVPESAVVVHAMSGWVKKDPPPPEPEPEEEAAAEAEPKAAKKTSKKTAASPSASDEE